jgi:very-short-patch-repair endonuclease
MNYKGIKELARKLRNNPTLYEMLLWQDLKDRKLDGYKFIRQHALVYDRRGNDLKFFIPDFYCAEARLVIELDGGIHRKTMEYDKWRDEIITHMNIKVIRFKNEEVIDVRNVLNSIRKHLQRNETRIV